MLLQKLVRLFGLVPFVFAIACSDDNDDPSSDASVVIDAGISDVGVPDAGGGGEPDAEVADTGEAPMLRCPDPTAPTCTDEQITELLLFDNISTGMIREEANANGVFTHYVDARGGGLMPNESYVYAKFTSAGLVKVDVSDEDAFDSQEWDISFRRYIIRLNSGVSGPSCVQAARVPNVTDFDAVTTADPNGTYRSELYMTDGTCDLVPDGSGLPGAAATALSSYWTYSSCLQMTNNVFVIHLADDRYVKLQVQSYYNEPGAQEECNMTGTAPMPSGSAQFVFKWAYLQ